MSSSSSSSAAAAATVIVDATHGVQLFNYSSKIVWEYDTEAGSQRYAATVHQLDKEVFEYILDDDNGRMRKELEENKKKDTRVPIRLLATYGKKSYAAQGSLKSPTAKVEIWTYHKKGQVKVTWPDEPRTGRAATPKKRPATMDSDEDIKRKKIRELVTGRMPVMTDEIEELKKEVEEKNKEVAALKKTLEEKMKQKEKEKEAQAEQLIRKAGEHANEVAALKKEFEERMREEQEERKKAQADQLIREAEEERRRTAASQLLEKKLEHKKRQLEEYERKTRKQANEVAALKKELEERKRKEQEERNKAEAYNFIREAGEERKRRAASQLLEKELEHKKKQLEKEYERKTREQAVEVGALKKELEKRMRKEPEEKKEAEAINFDKELQKQRESFEKREEILLMIVNAFKEVEQMKKEAAVKAKEEMEEEMKHLRASSMESSNIMLSKLSKLEEDSDEKLAIIAQMEELLGMSIPASASCSTLPPTQSRRSLPAAADSLAGESSSKSAPIGDKLHVRKGRS